MYASSYFEQDDGANLRFFFITAKKKKIFFLNKQTILPQI